MRRISGFSSICKSFSRGLVLSALSIVSALPGALSAQVTNATVVGTTKDSTGAVIQASTSR